MFETNLTKLTSGDLAAAALNAIIAENDRELDRVAKEMQKRIDTDLEAGSAFRRIAEEHRRRGWRRPA